MEERRGSVTTRELFTKALTVTDISKNHNRLIIPKAEAEKFFPDVKRDNDVKKYNSEGKPTKGTMLQFLERDKGQWLDFKYCFWVSAKSYVLTTNWYQFVANYGLKINDVIRFYQCEEVRGDERTEYFMIDIVRHEKEKIAQGAMKVKSREMIGILTNQMEMVDDNKRVEEEKVEEEAMEVENREMIDFFAPRERIDDSNKDVSEAEKVQVEAMEVEKEVFDFFPTKEEDDSGDHQKGIKLFGVSIRVDVQKDLKLFGVCIKG